MDASEHRNLAPYLHGGLKRRLSWSFDRLRSMTPAEMAYRVVRAVQARAERGGLVGKLEVPEPAVSISGKPWIFVPAKIDAARYLDAAQRISHGTLDVLALRGVQLDQPPRWNRDPKTGIEAPLAYGKTLDCADADVVGDIRYLREPNRHLHLVTLAQAYALSGRRVYLHTIVEHLDSWFLGCPFRMGPNWASAFEAATRLVNWAIAWQLVSEKLDAPFRARWLRSVYQHAEFIRGWLSLHSAANFELIGQAAALFIAGLSFPHWPKSREWVASGKEILSREALAQTAPDGVNREQAVWYQSIVLDFLILSLLAGKAHGEWFSPDYESRVEAMLDYIASIMDAGGSVPQFGDADDTRVVRLTPEIGCPYKSLLATGAVLFHRGDFKLKAGTLDDKTRWLVGPAAQTQYRDLDAEKTRLPLRQTFPEGGYFVLGCEFDTPNEIRIVADAGPLGYRSSAAHGHADALSFTLSGGGKEFLVDPGAYAYHTQGAWRRYFRGTSAHNTVRIDCFDQSVPGGSFLWLKKARAGCSLWLSSAQKDSFEGWHEGYLRLEDPVKHRRLIELDKTARRALIEDTLDMEEDHDVELFFHCHEDCAIQPCEGGFTLSRGERSIRLTLPKAENARFEVYHGSLAPIAGWVSRSFDTRVPAPTITWSARLTGRAVLRTEIRL